VEKEGKEGKEGVYWILGLFGHDFGEVPRALQGFEWHP
jgi:hypothetical protein